MNKYKKYVKNVKLEINKCFSLKELNLIKLKYLGRKGEITKKIKSIKDLSVNKKKKFSIIINKVKKKIKNLFYLKKNYFNKFNFIQSNIKNDIDISLSYKEPIFGSIHIITQIINDIQSYFSNFGFSIVFGKEIESDYYNFDALNITKDHPSRNKKDTFWFNSNFLLRTQTSSVQVRAMEVCSLPIRIISSGKVYRNDSSLTHSPMFHQIEGLLIDKGISFSNLKWMMYSFLKNFFSKKIKIRFRNSYFPFTTPSAEIDIFNKNSNKWLEVLGCGMVHPNVLKNVNIDSKIYSGLAFGIGIERLTMLKYNISNIRSFFKNDLRFLKQFK